MKVDGVVVECVIMGVWSYMHFSCMSVPISRHYHGEGCFA